MKKNFFKSLLIAISITSTPLVFAQDNLAVQTVKEMYDLGKRYEKGMEIIHLFADESLTQAFNHEAEYTDGICAYDHDLLWQSQDPEYNRKLTFTHLGNNSVKVNLGKGQWHQPSTVNFKMACKNGVCKVNDVIEDGTSLKANIYKNCN